MNENLVSFDSMRGRIENALDACPLPAHAPCVYLVRDLFGRLRMTAPEARETDEDFRAAAQRLAGALSAALGAHGYPADDSLLFVSDDLLRTLRDTAQQIRPRVFLADRLVTGSGWWTVAEPGANGGAARIVLYSIKGGVGRSTTAAVLAWHLARRGERVLVVDLDLESPGLSSAMLEPDRRPAFGAADWLVEDLVGQGGGLIGDMLAAPAWAQDFAGEVRVAPAHGREAGEYLAKLGRAYMEPAGEPWTKRLGRLLNDLEAAFEPTAVLLESRSGLHDIAAATVTDLDAEVLLFLTDTESNWTDYAMLFRHWNERGLAQRIRERLSIVSALTPPPDAKAYLERFRVRAWDLFREHLYDEIPAADPGDAYSFDLDEAGAPHDPMDIGWTVGLAAGASLYGLDEGTVNGAYGRFLRSFEERFSVGGNEGAS